MDAVSNANIKKRGKRTKNKHQFRPLDMYFESAHECSYTSARLGILLCKKKDAICKGVHAESKLNS